MKQQIILFIEPAEEEWRCIESIGNLYLNRFAIDEDTAHEVLGVYYLRQSSAELGDPKNEAYANYEIERQHKKLFDNEIFERGLKLIVDNRSSNVQTHIFIAGLLFEEGSELMEYLSTLMRDRGIPPILLTCFILNRIRVCTMEDVQSAYKDRGLILNKPPDLSKMTEEEITEVSFQIASLA